MSLFYPFSLPVLPTAFFGDIPNSDRNLMVRFGMNGFGGVGGCGDQGIDHSYNASGNNVTFIGSLYACEDKDLQDRCMGTYEATHNWWRKPIVRSYPFSDINYSYASSFRFQEPSKKNFTGPAPHLPKTVSVFSYRVARVDKSQEFFVRLADALEKNEPYTKELTSAISDLLTSLEGEPTQ